MRSLVWSLVVLTNLFAASAAGQPLRVATVVVGEAPPDALVRASVGTRALPDIEIEVVELPTQSSAPSSSDPLNATLVAARRAYLAGDAAACVAAVQGTLELVSRLGAGDRLGVARALSWLMACELAGGQDQDARAWARRFSELGLDMPTELDGPISPDVAELIVAEGEGVRASDPAMLEIRGRHPHGSVTLDGASRCAPPCTFEVVPGDHVVRLDADGVVPTTRSVHVPPEGTSVSFEPEPAGPDVAAAQWNHRYRGTARVESAASVRLLARALRRPHLALLVAERQGSGVNLRAAFAEDEEVRRRATAQSDPAGLEDAVEQILRDLLVDHLPEPAPPFYEEAWFWTLVGLVVAGGVTAAVLATQIQPPRRVRVVFGR